MLMKLALLSLAFASGLIAGPCDGIQHIDQTGITLVCVVSGPNAYTVQFAAPSQKDISTVLVSVNPNGQDLNVFSTAVAYTTPDGVLHQVVVWPAKTGGADAFFTAFLSVPTGTTVQQIHVDASPSPKTAVFH
jgi:hypothetical protein